MIKNNKHILNEITSQAENRIKDAINNVLRVRIVYNDKKPNVISSTRGYATRYILPVAFGLTKSGKKVVRAYQTFGSTKRGAPKWKLFLVDNIVSWNNGKKSFKDYKNALINLGLNLDGDKHMTTIYAITPFANDDVQISTYDDKITPEPIDKSEINQTVANIPAKNTSVDVNNLSSPKQNNIKNIDNDKNIHFINKVESPITKPFYKADIEKDSNMPTQPMDGTNDNVEDKTEIEEPNSTDTNDIENIKNNFNDMMSRMDNVYNNDENINNNGNR